MIPPEVPPEEDQRRGERRTRSRRRSDRHRVRNNRLFGLFFVVCIVVGYISLQSTVNSIKSNRVEGVKQQCVFQKTILDTLTDADTPLKFYRRIRASYKDCLDRLAQAKKDAQ